MTCYCLTTKSGHLSTHDEQNKQTALELSHLLARRGETVCLMRIVTDAAGRVQAEKLINDRHPLRN